jgi:hypothetical protein
MKSLSLPITIGTLSQSPKNKYMSQKPQPKKSVIQATTKIEEVRSFEPKSQQNNAPTTPLLFDGVNYQMLIGGIIVLLIGFALMAGGATSDPNVFNGEEKYSFQRITLAPMVVILGFIIEIVACFWGKNSEK